MAGVHTSRSPSGADRWMTCPGSVAAEAPFPDVRTEWAAEGTVLHEIAEQCLDFGLEPYDFVGRTMSADGFTFEITRDMAECMVPGLDFLREQPGEVVIEHRVDLGAWLPGEAGTLDVGIITDDQITVFDWKFGRGISVSPISNRQLMLYALGFWDNVARHKTKAKDFRIIVEQPRIPGAGGEWLCSLDELIMFGEEAVAAHAATFDPNAPRAASEKACQFCKAAMNDACDEYARFNLELMALKFEDLDGDEPPELPDPEEWTPERRAYVARHAGFFRKFMDRVHSGVLAEALSGKPTPGMKAVNGRRGARQWGDAKQAEKYLRRALGVRNAYETKLKSPAQAENELSTRQWAHAQKMITQPEPKPALVPESDTREAIAPVTDHFNDETDDLI